MRVERRGEHLDVASSLALASILADLVVILMHAEQEPAGRAAFGVLELDLDLKLQRMRRRELSYR